MGRKSEVYAWRVSPAVKAGLEEAARSRKQSVARVLDEIVTEHLGEAAPSSEAELDIQRRLHARAARFAGRIAGADPRRSETARAGVRARLNRRHAGAR